jgi:RNA polymerase sporulation-specific sigma factor
MRQEFLLRRRDEPHARVLLLESMRGVVVHMARRYFGPGLATDDLIAVGLRGVNEAIDTYKEGVGQFDAFACMIAKRRILGCVTAARRNKHTPLNESASLHVAVSETGLTLTDVEPDPAPGPHEIVVGQDRLRQVEACIATMSQLQREALVAVAWDGLDYEQAGALLGCDAKAIDNALQRARKRLRPLVTA